VGGNDNADNVIDSNADNDDSLRCQQQTTMNIKRGG
jgi:hypothetical protein